MIFPQQLVTMQISLDMEWSRIFVDMELAAICMKNRRSRISDSHGFAEELTLAVEPMINVGTKDVLWMDDEWTVVTEDKSLSAHYENTILITDGKPEILSLTEEEKKAGFLNLF